MFAFHRPRTFRSASGCCICKAKSSSSRFTDSTKYQHFFEKCFLLEEKRTGVICNACVLLIKRFRNLPKGSTKDWGHIVDARGGPGNKNKHMGKTKKGEGSKDENKVRKQIQIDDGTQMPNV